MWVYLGVVEGGWWYKVLIISRNITKGFGFDLSVEL
jgi:hypothetical protein